MRTGCMFFLGGLVCFLHCPILPAFELIYLFPLCVLLGLRFSGLRWSMWFICGILWGVFHADLILDNNLSAELENRHLTVEGVIDSLPVQLKGGQRFIFRVKSLVDARGVEHPHPQKIRLNWFYTKEKLILGDYWRLGVKLKPPHGFMNPGGFDFESWLFQQRIRATGYVSRKSGNLKLDKPEAINVHRLRYSMRNKLLEVLNNTENGGLLPALVVGDRSAMHAEQWRVLTATGTSHLLAISGLHIGLVASFVFFLTRWLWPLIPGVALILPAPRIAAGAAMLAALCYAAMAGFAVPTQRALLMLSVVFATTYLNRKIAVSSVIAAALLLVLLIDPFAPLSAGFWLSFGAIAVIALGMSARINSTGIWWRWGRVQYIVAIGLSPFLAFSFQQIPVLSIAANLFTVPWVSFITVPLALLGSVSIWLDMDVGTSLLQMSSSSIDLVWPFLTFLADLDFGLVSLPHTSIPALLCGILGVTLILLPRGLPGRWLGFIWVLPLLLPVQEKMAAGEVRLTLLDVGQGLSAVLETQNHVMLYDTGPRFSSRFDAGSAVIIPYFRRKQIKRVDLLIQSHGDNDHIGGLSNILEAMQVERVLTSVPDKIEHDKVDHCWRGQVWAWDEVDFEVLHPAKDSNLSGNDRSCVLKVSIDGNAILFTGDIEARAEQLILKRDSEKVSSSVLIAPHHGSLTSSAPKFIAAVMPEYVLFAVGYGNRFGFPKKDIIERYQNASVNILETARAGAIEIKLTSSGIVVNSYRQSSRRFWNNNY